MRFMSKPLVPEGASFESDDRGRFEPAVPPAFRLGDERLGVLRVLRSWRSERTDRGDSYLKRHWFEIELDDGRIAVVYFDRGARRGAPRWWCYTL